jgi:hypothetical protein
MRPLVAALVGATCWFATPARAQSSETGNAALNWSRLPGAEACADLAELARRVGAHLKRDAFVSPAKATVLIDASIQPAEPGFRVRIVLSSSDQATPGERTLTSLNPDCNEAVDSAALAIALMLDPDALTRSDEPAPTPPPDAGSSKPVTAPTPVPVVPLASAPAATPVAAKTPARPRVLRLTELAAGALGAHDQVAGNSFGVLAGLRRMSPSRSLGVELGLIYLAPRRLEVRKDTGGRFSLLGMGLSGAWTPLRKAPWAFSVLAGPQIARMFATGFGFTGSNRDAGSWLVSGTLEGEAALAVNERWDVVLRLGLGVPIWRDSFEGSVVGGSATILEPAPFFGTLKVALAFRP